MKKTFFYISVGVIFFLPFLLRSGEIGTNDFRISDMGTDGNTSFSASSADVAYNSTDHQYLVVWVGDDNSGSLVDNEFEVFGQLINASDGSEIGSDFRISDMGTTDGSALFAASSPAVAYNAADNEYLVVWSGDDDTGSLVDGEFEIYGQRIDSDGTSLGTNDFRISDMGSDGNALFGTTTPDVAYNSTNSEYLVVWSGDDSTNNEFEIFGQRLDGDGTALGTNDFQVSDMGPDTNTSFSASNPTVAYNSGNNQYLVVWSGDDNSGSLVSGEFQIWGQRIDASDGSALGTNDFRISEMGSTDGSNAFDAFQPSVAYNSVDGQYLVVWFADDNTGSLADNEFEIFGQRIDADGTSLGTNDFQISDMGTDGSTSFQATLPAVAYNAADDEFLVTWEADDNTGTLVDNENEIFGQRIDADGTSLGTNDFRISDMGTDGSTAFGATQVSLAYATNNNEYLIVWHGDDNSGVLVDNENEIFGQLFGEATCGNGVIDGAGTEACDDGNAADTDACLSSCVVASCGDGFVEDGEEECDDAAENSDETADACRTTCVQAACGDGIVDTGETCDDSNVTADDGCSATCQTEESTEPGDDGGDSGGDDDTGGDSSSPDSGGCSLRY